MSPAEIEIIMWHYVTPAEFPSGRFSDSFVEDTMGKLVALGVLFKCQNPKPEIASHTLSEMGKAYCEFLIEMPLPVEETNWVLP